MDIVIRGKAPSEYRYDGSCGTCKSVLKADHDELKHTYEQFDGHMHVGTCPVCLSNVWFSKERS
jgi:hypothetical protein